MRHTMNFHPVWGCLAPAPSFLRTMRAVLLATAVGAAAGGGVVLSLVDGSAGQTSVAERTLVGPDAVSAPLNAPQTVQEDAKPINQDVSTEPSWADSQEAESAKRELNGSSPVRQSVVAASAEMHAPTEGSSVKTAGSPSPTVHVRPRRVTERARRNGFVISSRQPQRSLEPQNAPNVIQRFLTGFTAVIEHGWPLPKSPANRTSRVHGNKPSATIS
jgi:hypothetical protein